MLAKAASLATRYPALFFFIYATLMVSDLILLRENALVDGSQDILAYGVAYLASLSSLIKGHGLVGWFPEWGGGIPVLSHPLMWWRPENLLYFILSPHWVYTVQLALAVFLAGWGTFKFLRSVEDHTPEASLIAGIVLASYSHFIVEATTLAGIPLFLYCFDRWVLSKKTSHSVLYFLGCLFYIASCNLLLGGPYVLLFHFSLCWRWVHSRRHTWKSFLYFLVLWILYGLLQFPHIANLLIEYPHVVRSKMDIPISWDFTYLFRAASFNVFILSVAAVGFLHAWKRRKMRIFTICLLAVIPVKLLWPWASGWVPLLKGGAALSRIEMIAPVFLTFLFSLGLQSLFSTEKPGKTTLKSWGWLVGAGFLSSLLISRGTFDLVLVAMSVPLVFLFAKRAQQSPVSPSTFAAILLLASTIGLGTKFIHTLQSGANTFRFFYHPKAIRLVQEREFQTVNPLYRIATYGISPAVPIYHGLQSIGMRTSYVPLRYQSFWYQVQNGGRDLVSHGQVSLFVPASNDLSDHVEMPTFNISLLALANVKYILSRVIIREPERYGLEPLWEEGMVTCRSLGSGWDGLKCRAAKLLGGSKASLYKMTRHADRFFTVGRLKLFDSDEDLSEALRAGSLQDFQSHLYLTKEEARIFGDGGDEGGESIPPETGSTAQNTFQKIDYTPDKIQISIEMANPGYLVMTENYSERWQCFDNGASTPIAPAYGTFRAVRLRQGSHNVVCEFSDIFSTLAARFYGTADESHPLLSTLSRRR